MEVSDETDFDAVVIGGGLAGVSAALRIARPDGVGAPAARVCLVEGTRLGGVLNWRAYAIVGSRYRFKEADWKLLEADMRDASIPVVTEEVVGFDLGGDVKVVRTTEQELRASAVVIASGAFRLRNATSYRQNDGFLTMFGGSDMPVRVERAMRMMRKRSLVIIGAEDSAELPGLLAHLAPIRLIEPPFAAGFVAPATAHVGKFVAVEGKGAVTGVVYEDGSGARQTIACDAVIYDFNSYMKRRVPSGLLAESGLDLVDGFVRVDREMNASISGVFAAGDVTGGLFGTTKSMHEGTVAGFSAIRFLNKKYYRYEGNYFAYAHGSYGTDYRHFRVPAGQHLTAKQRESGTVFSLRTSEEIVELDIEPSWEPLLHFIADHADSIRLEDAAAATGLDRGAVFSYLLALTRAGILDVVGE